ncbi:hypothetical protein EDC94DRAFT_490112, partial [Helicostylum pulchrum]
KTPMNRRYLKKSNIMNELSEVVGDAQDLIKADKACLVIIDSAGLTHRINYSKSFM